MYLRIYSHSSLQIYLQNTRKVLDLMQNVVRLDYTANEFAVTGANKFANTFIIILKRLRKKNYLKIRNFYFKLQAPFYAKTRLIIAKNGKIGEKRRNRTRTQTCCNCNRKILKMLTQIVAQLNAQID
jgi:hypothetical protein